MSLLPSTARALKHELAVVQSHDRQPSLVAGVMRDGQLAWVDGHGDVDGDAANTQYRIGSITKTMTAVMVLQCRDDGLLALDDPIGSYLPESPWPETPLRRLLTHTGGLPAELPGPWWEHRDVGDQAGLLAALAPEPLAVDPGSRLHYSNVGYALLGAAVERLRGGAWRNLLRERVLDPLGMERTTYGPVPPYARGHSVHPWSGRLVNEPHTDSGAMAPAGQLWSTVADLGRWAIFWLDPDPTVLAPDTAQEMSRPVAGLDDGAWGLGVSLSPGPHGLRVGHGGSMPGFIAGFLVDPAEGAAAVSFANAFTGRGAALAGMLLDALHAREPALPAAWSPEPEVAGADDLLGHWYWANTLWTLSVRAGRLTLNTGNPARDSRFDPDGDDRWRGLDAYFAGEELRVVRDPAGEIAHLELATYELTRQPYGG